jgi:hypothetical protein
VSLPGPSAGILALVLLGWAGATAVLGEAVRQLAARAISSWRSGEPIARLLLDFYLGGAMLYLLAALPIGGFELPVLIALPVLAAAGILARVVWGGRGHARLRVRSAFPLVKNPWYLLTLASALALFGFELALAAPIATGNTFDSSLLATYTALLLNHRTLPLTFTPYASTSILYPQGTTVWLAWGQAALQLPPARTSLLVTPLFFALAPLAGFVLGRRWFGTERAGAAVALVLAWLAPSTRTIVAGSNDFVFAFPLVLWLAAESASWIRSNTPISWRDALGFGALVGYSAALNPTGAEWLLPALFFAGLAARPAFLGAARRWVSRWAVAFGAALVALIPSWIVLIEGHASPYFVSGAGAPPAGTATGITAAQFLGFVDPFLFSSKAVQLSMVPALRIELAILLVVGLVLLVAVRRSSSLGSDLAPFRGFVVGAFVTLLAWLLVLWAASSGYGPAVAAERLTSASELSAWLFTLYVLVAALPLVLALERLPGPNDREGASRPAPAAPRPTSVPRPSPPRGRVLFPLAVALVVVVPGVVLTPTSLGPVLTDLYHDFGNVTQDDLALLEYAGSHLPAGARVLVAPGSAAEFLPGYASNVVLLFPMVPGWTWINASYHLVVDELTNATLDASGRAALTTLDVQYILVTGNSTVLWPAFSPAPLLADPSLFPVLWAAGDAYLFARS